MDLGRLLGDDVRDNRRLDFMNFTNAWRVLAFAQSRIRSHWRVWVVEGEYFLIVVGTVLKTEQREATDPKEYPMRLRLVDVWGYKVSRLLHMFLKEISKVFSWIGNGNKEDRSPRAVSKVGRLQEEECGMVRNSVRYLLFEMSVRHPCGDVKGWLCICIWNSGRGLHGV